MTARPSVYSVAVIGGGLSGALFGLKLAAARPDFRVIVIEATRRIGRGLAYGACTPQHLLNVPISRMEVGLTPGFADWLQANPDARDALSTGLAESGGDLPGIFVPRALFGAYLEERLEAALVTGDGPGLTLVRGEAVRVLARPDRAVRLSDGREIRADTVVLATGNLAPRAPGGPDQWFYDTPGFVPDPWAPDAFEGLGQDDPLLLLGTGLTTVDIVLKLTAAGHRGAILATSRRGLLPQVHAAGGAWPAFLEAATPASPRRLMRLIREQVAAATAQGIPWQRVFDAARPAVPAVWSSWSTREKRQFLRHLRTRWDVHRHRMARRIHDALHAETARGRLEILPARLRAYRPAEDKVEAILATRTGDERRFTAARVVNCTGPRRDAGAIAIPLLADLRDQGLALPDALGLGLETENCALLDIDRRESTWLFALGALTCPQWWEITAVPEIAVQVDRLVGQLANPAAAHLSAGDFLDLGAGI
ncbi:FAD/NAD(P)-binding protein [Sphingomonas sp. ZT3P38]|uniref:FAD/NAD(P)-binding protein n=1 Tax=Parasphingomonas zepuensis TaxID=3096161 RepID=UPI002FC86439